MTQIKTKIPAELEPAAVGGMVTDSKYIKDRVKNKTQKEINVDTEERVSTLEESVGTGGSVDERIAEEGAKHYLKTETYSKTELNNMITTPNQEYVTVTAIEQTTAVTDVLPASGEADTVYRVGNWDGSQYDTTCYTEYSWNGSAYVKLNTKEYGIDDAPTAGSENLVKSGGVHSDFSQLNIYRQTSLSDIDITSTKYVYVSSGEIKASNQSIARTNTYVVEKGQKYKVRYNCNGDLDGTAVFFTLHDAVVGESATEIKQFISGDNNFDFTAEQNGYLCISWHFGSERITNISVEKYVYGDFIDLPKTKVEVIPGKGLSTNDFTNEDKENVNNIPYLMNTVEGIEIYKTKHLQSVEATSVNKYVLFDGRTNTITSNSNTKTNTYRVLKNQKYHIVYTSNFDYGAPAVFFTINDAIVGESGVWVRDFVSNINEFDYYAEQDGYLCITWDFAGERITNITVSKYVYDSFIDFQEEIDEAKSIKTKYTKAYDYYFDENLDVDDISNSNFTPTSSAYVSSVSNAYIIHTKAFKSYRRKIEWLVDLTSSSNINFGTTDSPASIGVGSRASKANINIVERKLSLYDGGNNVYDVTEFTDFTAGKYILRVSQYDYSTKFEVVNYNSLETLVEKEIIATYQNSPVGKLIGYPYIQLVDGSINVYNYRTFLVNEPLIVFVGDSITECGLRQNTYAAMFISNDASNDGCIIALGGANQDTLSMSWNSELPFIKPKYISLLAGTNGEITANNIRNWKTRCDAIGATLIVNCIPVSKDATSYPWQPENDIILSTTKELGLMCARFDMATALNNNPDDGANEDLFADTVHPNAAGQEAMYHRFLNDVILV